MSTPAPPSPSLHPIRRQLDELDALMEQMLELPVNPVEDGSTNSPSLESAETSPFEGFSPNGIISYHTEDSNDERRMKKEASQGVIPSSIPHPSSIRGDDAGPPPPIWLWPVVAMNRVYDALMGGLGTPGRVMRGTGRVWLGWIGLILLATALAWGLFDWLQWAG